MLVGCDTVGTAPIGSTGTAAGTSKAVGKGGVVAVTLYMGGRAIRSGPAVEVELDESRLLNAPPATAERLLCYLLPKAEREAILGDLEEDYRTNFLPKFGPREARWMYWSHAIRSVVPVLRRAAVRWSVVAAIAELLRRTFGR